MNARKSAEETPSATVQDQIDVVITETPKARLEQGAVVREGDVSVVQPLLRRGGLDVTVEGLVAHGDRFTAGYYTYRLQPPHVSPPCTQP